MPTFENSFNDIKKTLIKIHVSTYNIICQTARDRILFFYPSHIFFSIFFFPHSSLSYFQFLFIFCVFLLQSFSCSVLIYFFLSQLLTFLFHIRTAKKVHVQHLENLKSVQISSFVFAEEEKLLLSAYVVLSLKMLRVNTYFCVAAIPNKFYLLGVVQS